MTDRLPAATLVALSLLGTNALAQAPTPPANAQIPGTNLFRCGTPEGTGPLFPQVNPSDCSYNLTNPSAAYAPTNIIDIPVVVHVIQNTSGTGNLSDTLVQSQITVLNEDFRGLAGTPGAGGVDTKVQFHLATVDPNGNPTTGITHHTNATWFADSGSYWNSIGWPTDRYLNIYTNNAGGGGVLGYVPDLPQGGSVLNTLADRVVILYSTFGRPGSLPPYNTGRTTTHEVGHYLGLFHTFQGGCAAGSCYSGGDRICDTNNESTAVFGCPGSSTTCGSPDPFHNYMDYTDDTCMTNFTAEQARRIRCTLMNYRPNLGGQAALATSYGSGCYEQHASLSQQFTIGGFDLGGTALAANVLAFTPTSNGYLVDHGTSAWFAPVSANLGLGDEQLATCNLPFTFNFPGGSTAVVKMSSNGFAWLNGTSTDTGSIPITFYLANNPARFAPMWQNLNPALGGSCHYDIDPSNSAVYLTWLNVLPSTGTGAGNTFQLVLRADGSAEYRYLVATNQPSLCCTGYGGGSTATPPNVDLSATLPQHIGPEALPLSWTAANRPVLGTTQTIDLGNLVNPASSIGLAIIGWSGYTTPLDLAVIGAPGCKLHAATDALEVFSIGGLTPTWSLPIPSTQSLVGFELFTQGALFTPGVNALGLLTANAVKLTIGSV